MGGWNVKDDDSPPWGPTDPWATPREQTKPAAEPSRAVDWSATCAECGKPRRHGVHKSRFAYPDYHRFADTAAGGES